MNKTQVPFRTTLDQVSIGQAMTVLRVVAPPKAMEWTRWLEEIGFVAGEPVRLIAKALPGGDPMVVRVGQSTFALRCAEAACIEVEPAETLAGVCDGVYFSRKAAACCNR